MYAPAPALALNAGQKAEIEALVRSGNTPQKVACRARLLLLTPTRASPIMPIAQQLNLSRPTVLLLRVCFARDGMAAITGIRKRKRSGTVLTPALEQKILDTTLEDPAPR